MVWQVAHRCAAHSALPGGGTAWLSASELESYRLRPGEARPAWLLGRLLAKQLIREWLAPGASAADLEIHSRDGTGRAMRPQAFFRGRPLACSLSISHSQRHVLVGLASRPGWLVGVDVVDPFSAGPGFLDLWTTRAERGWLDGGGCSAAGLWAIKEAAYKAVNRGEPFRPASIEVRPLGGGRCAFASLDPRRPAAGRSVLISIGRSTGALVACEAM